MANLMFVFITAILLSLSYWHIVRPVFMHAIRFRLFARRDQLRELAIDGVEDAKSDSYIYLEAFINKTVAFIPSVGLFSFIIYAVLDNRTPSTEYLRFEEQASADLKEIRNKSIQDALLLMTVNSPVMVMLAAVVGSVLWVCGKINKIMVFTNAENFVDDLRTVPV